MRSVIKHNRIQCTRCGEVIESENRHDYKTCSCGAVSVDGGHDYLRRSFSRPDDYIELSEVESENTKEHNA